MRTFSHTLPMRIEVEGDSLEVEVAIDYTYLPGTPDTWEEPGDPPELEVHVVTLVLDKDEPRAEVLAPRWLREWLGGSRSVFEALGRACRWGDDDGPDPDEAYDRMRDERDERA